MIWQGTWRCRYYLQVVHSITLTKYFEKWDTPVVAVWWSGSRWVLGCMRECQTIEVGLGCLHGAEGLYEKPLAVLPALNTLTELGVPGKKSCWELLFSIALSDLPVGGLVLPFCAIKSYTADELCAIRLCSSETVLTWNSMRLFGAVAFYLRLAGPWPWVWHTEPRWPT